jgi:phosphoribosyl 1,2-cyclic phosphodiesterase
VKVTLWGTRGSLPAAGPETVHYGGNTSCVEVRGDDGTLLVLDAGTGIRRLSTSLRSKRSRVNILLSHFHMDHIQGIGFFEPLHPHVRDLPSRFTLEDVPLGTFQVGGLKVAADLVCHPGPTVGYRITEGDRSIAYLSDHEPALGVRRFPGDPEWTSGFDLARGVDLLLHDAQYTDFEYAGHVGWGHSSLSQALAFAGAAGVGRLVTFHHDPSHDDSFLDGLLDEARRGSNLPFELIPGAEGASFQL